MKTYCVLLSVLGAMMVIANLVVLLFFNQSVQLFRFYAVVEYLFGAFGLFALGLYLIIFSAFVHHRLARQEREELLRTLLN